MTKIPLKSQFSYTDFFAALDPGKGCVKIKNIHRKKVMLMSHKHPDLTRVYAPPGANTTIPENLPPPGAINPGLVKNLLEQVTSIYKHSNEKSFKTRVRYYEAAKRFCCFLAARFRLEKFKNVDDRHFRAYAEYLKATGASPATIQAELAGIRFFYRLSGGKNNRSLNLPKRVVGTENRAWLPEEKEKAIMLAERMGRTDVVIALDLAYELGLRVEEICVTRVEFLMSANRHFRCAQRQRRSKTRDQAESCTKSNDCQVCGICQSNGLTAR